MPLMFNVSKLEKLLDDKIRFYDHFLFELGKNRESRRNDARIEKAKAVLDELKDIRAKLDDSIIDIGP